MKRSWFFVAALLMSVVASNSRASDVLKLIDENTNSPVQNYSLSSVRVSSNDGDTFSTSISEISPGDYWFRAPADFTCPTGEMVNDIEFVYWINVDGSGWVMFTTLEASMCDDDHRVDPEDATNWMFLEVLGSDSSIGIRVKFRVSRNGNAFGPWLTKSKTYTVTNPST